MSNRNQPTDYTTRYQVLAGRVNYANYVQRRQLVQDGRLLGLNLYLPTNDASIIPSIQEGELNTTPAELAGYLAEVARAPIVTVPDAPTGVTAVAGSGEATVSFVAPASDGGAIITRYTVTSSPGGFTATGISSPLTVTGLTIGTEYTFTVVATNRIGNSVASAASDPPVTPTLPSGNYYSEPSTTENVSIVEDSPFTGGGNSYFFDSTAPNPDYLTVVGDDSWAFGTGDFTIEWFQYQTDTNSFPRIFAVGSYPNTSIGCSIEGTFIAWFSNAQFFGDPTPYKDVWVHFAIVRQSGQLYVYKNGVLFGTSEPNSTDITDNTTTLYIGIEGSQEADTQFLGNLTNIRIVKGLAVYTGDFTVPTSALTAIAEANPYGPGNTVAIPEGYTKLLLVPSFPATVPGAPTAVNATAGNTQATVSFTAPVSDGGDTITGYTVTSSPSGGTATGASSPLTVTGLTNGTAYTFTVVATNSVGNSVASAASDPPVTPVTPVTVPGAPTAVIGTAGNALATVYFTAPASDGGSTITGYTATSSPDGRIETGVSSPLIFTGLTNDTAYTFTVVATNSIGNSVPSAASAAVTPTTTGSIPGAPTSLFGVGGNEAIYVLFTAGAANGSAITNYQYSIDGGAFTAFSPPQVISPVLISGIGLVNTTSYSVILKAVNAIGASLESASLSVTPTVTSLLATSRIINLDATNSSSYIGSGTAWTNLDSGGSYSATLNGTPTYNTTDTSNKYFEFNPGAATGQFAQINQAAAINPVINTPFTIQIWVRINNIGSQGSLVSKVFGSSSYDGYALGYRTDSSLQLHENGTSSVNYFTSLTNVLINGWALYTTNIQFGNGGGRTNTIFVNGRQVLINTVSNETSIFSSNQNLTLATGFYGEGECDIAAFYYYNAQLTVTQIIQNFDATKSRYGY